MEQFISGESKKIFRVSSHTLLIGLTVGGKYAWQEEEEIKIYSSAVLMLQEQLFISELVRDIQDAILLILSLKDNVVIQSNFFQYTYHVGFAFNLTFYHQLWINTWRPKFEQKTDSILSAC